ncbi:MAG: MtrB/PioB family outer membrane beta-barrel protein [Acidobacteriota bacterium]
MYRRALQSCLVSMLTLAVGGVTAVRAAETPSAVATERSEAAQDSSVGTADAGADAPAADVDAMQSTSGWPQEATRPMTLFPSWSLRSTQVIDPRINPNAGLRIPRSYYPIAGGPLLYPNYSPVEPDFMGGQPTNNWSVRQSIGFFGVEDDHVSSKFQEYRDVRNGLTAGLEGHFRSGNTFLNLKGLQIGRKDQEVALDGGVAGTVQYALNYSETPHTYAYDARSLWAGIGTGRLTLPDGMQADLQSTASNAELASRLLRYVNSGGENVDLELHRQNLGAELSVIATYPFVLKASASNESRDGVRPWSASFGFGNFVELPWPVKYDTQELRLVAEFAKPESPIYASGAYRFSNFVDHIQELTFDNPYRLVDAAGGLNCTFACGPSTGRLALYPSNQYHEVSGVVAIKKLPLNSTFNAYVSAGFMRQDEDLQPFSTNSADPLMKSPVNPSFNATDPAGLPRDSAETAMNTKTVSMRWTSDLSKKARLVAQYRYYGLDNDETPFTMYQFVREDEDIRNPETVGGTYSTVLAQYSKHTATVEGTYQFSTMSKASAVYTFERMNRDEREVEWMKDNKLKLEYDAVVFGSLDVKTWYERSRRTTAPYEFDLYNIVQGNPSAHPMLPFIEKFDEAAYDRNEAQVMATYAISDAQTFSGHVQVVSTDYDVTDLGELSRTLENVTTQVSDAVQFGVRSDHHYSVGLDYTWAPTERWSIFAEGGYEQREYESMSRQWTVNGISDPYLRQRTLESNSNWTVRARDNYLTGGVGADASIIPEKLKLTVQYVFAKSDGRHAYSSPVGTAAVDDVNAFNPVPFDDVDDTTIHSFNPELSYDYSDRITLAAGYQWEKWDVDDYNYKGFTYAPLYTNGVAMLMGGLLPQPYSSNVAYIRIKMGF